MIEVVLVAWLAFWFGRQFYGKRAERWRARGEAIKPLGVVMRQDALAIGRMVRMAFSRHAQEQAILERLEVQFEDDQDAR